MWHPFNKEITTAAGLPGWIPRTDVSANRTPFFVFINRLEGEENKPQEPKRLISKSRRKTLGLPTYNPIDRDLVKDCNTCLLPAIRFNPLGDCALCLKAMKCNRDGKTLIAVRKLIVAKPILQTVLLNDLYLIIESYFTEECSVCGLIVFGQLDASCDCCPNKFCVGCGNKLITDLGYWNTCPCYILPDGKAEWTREEMQDMLKGRKWRSVRNLIYRNRRREVAKIQKQ